MDKQIEELMKDMCTDYPCNRICDQYCGMYDYAERAINAGYRKIPENAVVVSRAEYNDLKGLEKHFDDYLIKEIVATRKETAEKFAKAMRDCYPPREHPACTLDDCYMLDRIDEICKELGGE